MALCCGGSTFIALLLNLFRAHGSTPVEDPPVNTKGNASMRWRPARQRIQKEAEFVTGFVLDDADGLKDLQLHLCCVVPQAATYMHATHCFEFHS